VTDTAAAA